MSDKTTNNWSLYVFYAFVAAIFLFLYWKSCQEPACPPIENITKITIDTIYFPPDTIKVNIPIVKYRTIYDTIWGIRDSIKLYTSRYEDSLIAATIENRVYGILLQTQLNYVPKFPKFIYRTDSIFQTAYLPVGYKPKSYVHMGMSVSGNKSSFDFGPMIGYNYKEKGSFGYGYNFLTKSHQIYLTRRISFKNGQ